MASIYDSVIGAPPADGSAQQQAIADALRRRSQLGAIGVLTGDPAMAAQGQMLQQGADDYGKTLAVNREHGIDNARTQNYQDAQIAHEAGNLAETKRSNDLMFNYRKAMADVAQQNADTKQGAATGAGGVSKQADQEIRQYTTKMDSSGLTELQGALQNYHNLVDKYLQKGQVPPGMGRLGKYSAANAAEGKDAQDIQGALQAVKNGIMRARSGLAVTEPEAARLSNELEESLLNSGESKVQALARLESLINDRTTNMQTIMGDEAKTEYARRASRGTPTAPVPAASGWGKAQVVKK